MQVVARMIVLVAVLCGGFASTVAEADDDSAAAASRQAMIQRIDSRLADRWRESEITSADLAEDSEFLRRAYLDLTGVIPRVSEVRAFLGDQSRDKRGRLINRLLESPSHATHMAVTWRDIMLPGGFDESQAGDPVGLQSWFREQFVRNLRYDRIVSEFLMATGRAETGPAVFYTAQELKPEKLAAATSRIFLGVQIECAQCHDHPSDRWLQSDFWGYAAFFARLRQPTRNQTLAQVSLDDLGDGEVMLPDSDTVIAPKYPGGRSAREEDGGTRRMQLAIWMTSRDNPFLARAAVNRAWAHLFGRGIVEPVDDFGPHNPPSHPELLDELAEYFVRTGFDLRELYRTLASTRAYQLTSRSSADSPPPPELFARMAIKTLTPEQLYDSLSRALARPGSIPPGTVAPSSRAAFIAKMKTLSRSPAEYEAGVPQALTLLNGADISAAADPRQSGLLTALEAPLFNDAQRLDVLFLATLSRPPRDDERLVFSQYIARAESDGRGRAMGDVLWALLNSAEFALNH